MKSSFKFKKNKKGDIQTLLFLVIALMFIGIVFLFMNHLNQKIFIELEEQLTNSNYNDTEAYSTLTTIQLRDQSVWDYAFIIIFVGCLIATAISAWAVRISPVFFWIYVILGIFILVAGVILSNVWQDLANDPAFASEIARLPMTNMILGSYYPLAITAILIITLGLLFGKPPMEG